MLALTMNSWKVLSVLFREANGLARLTEFLRDFKSVNDPEEDLYGDGMDIDMDNIQPKYMTIMVHFPDNMI
jgi:hypothetical protein